MLLKDSAFDWFMALPDVKKDTMEQLTASLIARYVTDSNTQWNVTQTIFQMTQGQTPVVDYYILSIHARHSTACDGQQRNSFCSPKTCKHRRSHKINVNSTMKLEIPIERNIAHLMVKDKECTFLVDSGAHLSCISLQLFHESIYISNLQKLKMW